MYKNNQKYNEMTVSADLSMIILNISILNVPIKRHTVAYCRKRPKTLHYATCKTLNSGAKDK